LFSVHPRGGARSTGLGQAVRQAQDKLLTGQTLRSRGDQRVIHHNPALRQAQGRLLTGQVAPELRSSGSSPSALAAINGLSRRHLYGAICVPGDSTVTDRIAVIAAMRTCGPQLA
jgi:hypothetical protein